MLDKTIALIPARKGSKRVKDKNIRLLDGKPLISRTIENALTAFPPSLIYLSTNDERIYPIADKYKVNLIKRPEEFSAANSSMEAVIYNFLNSINFNCNILLLQPTNPFRLPETTKEFLKIGINRIDSGHSDIVISVHESNEYIWICKEGPDKIKLSNKNSYISKVFPNDARRQQDRVPHYIENSSYYLFSSKHIKSKIDTLIKGKVSCHVIPIFESLDINNEQDMLIAETYIKSGEFS